MIPVSGGVLAVSADVFASGVVFGGFPAVVSGVCVARLLAVLPDAFLRVVLGALLAMLVSSNLPLFGTTYGASSAATHEGESGRDSDVALMAHLTPEMRATNAFNGRRETVRARFVADSMTFGHRLRAVKFKSRRLVRGNAVTRERVARCARNQGHGVTVVGVKSVKQR